MLTLVPCILTSWSSPSSSWWSESRSTWPERKEEQSAWTALTIFFNIVQFYNILQCLQCLQCIQLQEYCSIQLIEYARHFIIKNVLYDTAVHLLLSDHECLDHCRFLIVADYHAHTVPPCTDIYQRWNATSGWMLSVPACLFTKDGWLRKGESEDFHMCKHLCPCWVEFINIFMHQSFKEGNKFIGKHAMFHFMVRLDRVCSSIGLHIQRPVNTKEPAVGRFEWGGG